MTCYFCQATAQDYGRYGLKKIQRRGRHFRRGYRLRAARQDLRCNEADRERYSPSEYIGAVRKVITGDPKPEMICASHVERSNPSMRTFLRRMTRLCLGFSKKLENLRAAVALYFAWYNFVRVHGSLRVTPAMEVGLTDHIWTIGELLNV